MPDCISANSLPAFAAARTDSSLMFPLTLLENDTIASANALMPDENVSIDELPVNHSDTLSKIFAPDISNIILANEVTPDKADSSIPLAPSMKGCKFVMNDDKFSPMPGNPEVTPSENPPTMLPKNAPKP